MLQRKTEGRRGSGCCESWPKRSRQLTAERPLLLLWLEDLHWSDVSTLDLLACVARRRESARLLILGTYRPVEVLAQRPSAQRDQARVAGTWAV